MIDFNGSLLDRWQRLHLCAADMILLRHAVNFTRDRLRRHVLTHQLLVLVLEQHVVDRRQTDARAQDVVDARPLAEQRVDERRTAWNERSLAQEAQDRQH